MKKDYLSRDYKSHLCYTFVINELTIKERNMRKNKLIAAVLVLTVTIPMILSALTPIDVGSNKVKLVFAFGVYLVTPLAGIRLFFKK